jgi:hypothetical protein
MSADDDAPEKTVVSADAELFSGEVSELAEVTCAVFRMLVPSGVPLGTPTTSRTDRAASGPTAVRPDQIHLTDPPRADRVASQVPPGLGDADTKETSAGIASVIDTALASSGPRLVATSAYVIAPPGNTLPVLAVLVNAMSATAGGTSLIAVAKSDVLFAGTGSIVEADTVAVLTRVPAAVVALTLKMAVMVRVWPDASAPRLQGKGVVQAPEFETNVRPAGVTSATITACASPGPALVTVSTYEIASPGRAVASPVLTTERSAEAAVTTVVAVELLLPGSRSLAVVVTVAVLRMVAGPA